MTCQRRSGLGADAAAVFHGPIALSPMPNTVPSRLSDTGEIFWAQPNATEKGCVTVSSPRSKALIGATDERLFKLGDGVEVTPGKTLQGWSAITLTALDGEGFKPPARILVTATGYVQNTGMIWKDAAHDSVGKDWGHAPALVEGIPATIVLPLAAGTTLRAWALDGRGQRGREVPIQTGAGQATIVIGPEFKTLWYEIELTR